MIINKDYCASSFLMFRLIENENYTFAEDIIPNISEGFANRFPIKNSNELESVLYQQVKECVDDGKTALALSGGIDSAILAKFMPKGTKPILSDVLFLVLM